MILNPTLILDAAMWLTAIAGLAVAAGQVWELLKARSANVLLHEGLSSDLDKYAKLESDLAKLLELHEHSLKYSEKIRSPSRKRPTYRISMQYERGRFEFLVLLLASNKVIDQWKWSEAEGVVPAKQGSNVDSEIVEARQAIMRDLAGKLGVTHG